MIPIRYEVLIFIVNIVENLPHHRSLSSGPVLISSGAHPEWLTTSVGTQMSWTVPIILLSTQTLVTMWFHEEVYRFALWSSVYEVL